MPAALLIGRHQNIEPLGLMALAGVARDAGWDRDCVLVKDGDFDAVVRHAIETRPDLVAFSVWTGFHLQSFRAADAIRAAGIKVAIGGPHATYFSDDCAKHADFVCKGAGFRTFRRILDGTAQPGISFDDEIMADGFPIPDRATVYDRYPDLAASPIKSMMCSVGCPFTCSYCYAPAYNVMYGGFKLSARPVDHLIQEAQEVRDRWPARMIYMQDDVMGFRMDWLEELAARWPVEVGIPWHCQIRLEMTREERRLDLFKAGGCTGITLAIESGNDWLRRFVLHRGMADNLIVEGIRKIQARGLTLRTEQILAVPFSDIDADLETLELNTRLNPEMAWTSILAPYGGTEMGKIASTFGFYGGTNDDLSETFFDRSVMRHSSNGRFVLDKPVRAAQKNEKDNPLTRMVKVWEPPDRSAAAFAIPGQSGAGMHTIKYMTREENDWYAGQTVSLQRIFYWLAKIPKGHELGRAFVTLPQRDRTWIELGRLAHYHLLRNGYTQEQLDEAVDALLEEIGIARLPGEVQFNPWYFVFMPSGGEFALKVLSSKCLKDADPFVKLGTITRHWLFHRALYLIEPALPPILVNRHDYSVGERQPLVMYDGMVVLPPPPQRDEDDAGCC